MSDLSQGTGPTNGRSRMETLSLLVLYHGAYIFQTLFLFRLPLLASSCCSVFSFQSGILLHTNTLIPANQPVKAVICYCHGFLDDVTFTKRQPLLHFVQQGIAVLTISYEGHGKSDGTLGLVKDFHVLADDVKDYFHETCAKKFPDKKYFLMGEVSIFSCRSFVNACTILLPYVHLR